MIAPVISGLAELKTLLPVSFSVHLFVGLWRVDLWEYSLSSLMMGPAGIRCATANEALVVQKENKRIAVRPLRHRHDCVASALPDVTKSSVFLMLANKEHVTEPWAEPVAMATGRDWKLIVEFAIRHSKGSLFQNALSSFGKSSRFAILLHFPEPSDWMPAEKAVLSANRPLFWPSAQLFHLLIRKHEAYTWRGGMEASLSLPFIGLILFPLAFNVRGWCVLVSRPLRNSQGSRNVNKCVGPFFPLPYVVFANWLENMLGIENSWPWNNCF